MGDTAMSRSARSGWIEIHFNQLPLNFSKCPAPRGAGGLK